MIHWLDLAYYQGDAMDRPRYVTPFNSILNVNPISKYRDFSLVLYYHNANIHSYKTVSYTSQ